MKTDIQNNRYFTCRPINRITGNLHEERYIFLIMSRSVLLRLKKVAETIKTHVYIIFSEFFFSENRAVYEIVWGGGSFSVSSCKFFFTQLNCTV